MMGKMSAHQMEKMMRTMGIKSETLDVKEVLFRFEDRELIVRNPVVQKVNIPGQGESFQVIGTSEEVVTNTGPSEEDVQLVVEKTGCTKEEAEKALSVNGDIAEAIISLSEKS